MDWQILGINDIQHYYIGIKLCKETGSEADFQFEFQVTQFLLCRYYCSNGFVDDEIEDRGVEVANCSSDGLEVLYQQSDLICESQWMTLFLIYLNK